MAKQLSQIFKGAELFLKFIKYVKKNTYKPIQSLSNIVSVTSKQKSKVCFLTLKALPQKTYDQVLTECKSKMHQLKLEFNKKE